MELEDRPVRTPKAALLLLCVGLVKFSLSIGGYTANHIAKQA